MADDNRDSNVTGALTQGLLEEEVVCPPNS